MRRIFLLVVALFWPIMAAATDHVFTGYARDLDSRELLYIESHTVRELGTLNEQRVVKYLCSRGDAAFARKVLQYGANRTEPAFRLDDARTGYVEGLQRTGTRLEVFKRESGQGELRKRAVPTTVAIVSDAGFDEFVRKHWSELESGKAVRFPFLVPSRLDYMSFKVQKNRDTIIEGQPASVMRLNLSGFLGRFLPHIEVSDRILMRYKGLTNIRDASGKNVIAQIDFPSRERVVKPTNLDALKSAPLVSACS
jgi:hypothetical protein